MEVAKRRGIRLLRRFFFACVEYMSTFSGAGSSGMVVLCCEVVVDRAEISEQQRR